MLDLCAMEWPNSKERVEVVSIQLMREEKQARAQNTKTDSNFLFLDNSLLLLVAKQQVKWQKAVLRGHFQ